MCEVVEVLSQSVLDLAFRSTSLGNQDCGVDAEQITWQLSRSPHPITLMGISIGVRSKDRILVTMTPERVDARAFYGGEPLNLVECDCEVMRSLVPAIVGSSTVATERHLGDRGWIPSRTCAASAPSYRREWDTSTGPGTVAIEIARTMREAYAVSDPDQYSFTFFEPGQPVLNALWEAVL